MSKKKLVSKVSILLAVLLLLTFTAGCGASSSQSVTEADTTVASNASTSAVASTSAGTAASEPVSKDKLTLKILTESYGEEWKIGNDQPVFKLLEEKTNVHLEWQILPTTNPEEKLSLVMASGDLPDLLAYGNQDLIIKYGTDGALIPLQDLIEKFGPHIKQTFDNPLPGDKLPYKLNTWAELTANNGNIYTIPVISSTDAIGPVYGIRTDWLKNVNLEIPDTIDELYNALKAFKEKDPNGNGKQDELPLVAGHGSKTNAILPLINSFGAHMNLYIDKNGDTIKYGPVEPQYKDGLQFLNKLYKEGLLESDYLTSTGDQWKAKATGNLAGCMFIWPAGGFAVTNAGLRQLNPNFTLMPILPPKGANGVRFKDNNTSGNYVLYRTSITSTNKHPEETMKYLDYMFTDEASLICAFGVEGKDYTIVDGKPKYTDYVIHNPDGLDPETSRGKDGINWMGLPYQCGWDSHFQAMQETAPWTVKAWETYREPGVVEAPFPTLKFTDDEFSKRNQIITEVDTYKDAMIDKFIMGQEPLEKFDEFVASINKAGLEELLKIENDAYIRYKSFGSK